MRIDRIRLTELGVREEIKYCGALPPVRTDFLLLEIGAEDATGEMMIWLGLSPEAAGRAVEAAGRAVLGLDPRRVEQVLAAVRASDLFIDPKVTASFDIALWDLLGKLYDVPIHVLLGGSRDRLPAYASGMWHPAVDGYVAEARAVAERGFTKYKLHPAGVLEDDLASSQVVADAVGDDLELLFDAVGSYRDRTQALRLGTHLQELGYTLFEAPLPDRDHDGYVHLSRHLDIPLASGEWINDPRDFAQLVDLEAVQVVRTIGEWGLGITGMAKVGHLCEAHSLILDPESYGPTLVQAAHLHVQLGLPNAMWFEAPVGDQEDFLDVAMLDRVEIVDGNVVAPTRPGLGYRVDHDEVDARAQRRWEVTG